MNTSLGIALAGGGARGIAHIGVLQALEENGISPQFVSGASAGSIVGSLYAAGIHPQEILSIIKETSLIKLFSPALPTAGLTDLGSIKEILADHIPEDSFESLQRRMFISVTNLTKGRDEIAYEGPLFEWIVASSSIPILFKARKINEEVYVDGGVLNNLPVEPLKALCQHVIGVNVSPILKKEDLSDLLKIGYRTMDMVMWANVEARLKMCDIAIEPRAGEYGFFEITKADEIYQEGYERALEQVPRIQELKEASAGKVMPVTYSMQTPSAKPIRQDAASIAKEAKERASDRKKLLLIVAMTLIPMLFTGGLILANIDKISWDHLASGMLGAFGATILIALGAFIYVRKKRQ